MNTLWVDVVVAGVNQRHGFWKSGQLPEVIFSDDQLLQLRQTHKGSIIDGRDLVGSQVDPLQFIWNKTPEALVCVRCLIAITRFSFRQETYSCWQSQTCWSLWFCCSERRSEWCLWAVVERRPASSRHSRRNLRGTCTAGKRAYLKHMEDNDQKEEKWGKTEN